MSLKWEYRPPFDFSHLKWESSVSRGQFMHSSCTLSAPDRRKTSDINELLDARVNRFWTDLAESSSYGMEILRPITPHCGWEHLGMGIGSALLDDC